METVITGLLFSFSYIKLNIKFCIKKSRKAFIYLWKNQTLISRTEICAIQKGLIVTDNENFILRRKLIEQ